MTQEITKTRRMMIRVMKKLLTIRKIKVKRNKLNFRRMKKTKLKMTKTRYPEVAT